METGAWNGTATGGEGRTVGPPRVDGERGPTSGGERGATIRILTFNIGNGCGRPEALIPLLRSVDCDLVALQEVSADQASALQRELLDDYPHRVIEGRGVAGKALLSKHPIVAHEEWILLCGRPHLRAEVEISGRRLHLVVAHVPLEHTLVSLVSPVFREIDALARATVAASAGLLVGDFNKTPFSLLHRRLRRHGLNDSFEEVGSGPGFTFPVFGRYLGLPLPPLVRIDYVWHTSDLRAIGCRAGPDGGSDHLPVQAELAFLKDIGP
jgi:endonuclease/exonuclease/phosphatase (EEP) superfamily protein YafD